MMSRLILRLAAALGVVLATEADYDAHARRTLSRLVGR